MRELTQNISACVKALPYNQHYSAVIESLVRVFPGPAHIKNGTTLAYSVVNQRTLEHYGFRTAEGITGKKLSDISLQFKQRWPKNYCEEIFLTETALLKEKTDAIIIDEFPYVNAAGKLVMYNITKIPLLNTCHESIGLLTLAFNILTTQGNDFLRATYQTVFGNKKEALEKFLMHIGLTKFIGISNRELDCLIERARGKSFKEIGKRLSLSPRTVEYYIQHLKEKLQYSSDAEMMEEFFKHYF